MRYINSRFTYLLTYSENGGQRAVCVRICACVSSQGKETPWNEPEIGDVLEILHRVEEYRSSVDADDGARLGRLRVDDALTQHAQTQSPNL